MWLLVFFDLPVRDRVARRAYARFRNHLIKLGFNRIQYSVYGRPFPGEDAANHYRRSIREALPAQGMVSILTVTDRQFGKIENYVGKKRDQPPRPPDQMLLF